MKYILKRYHNQNKVGRLIALLCTLILSLSLAGCGSSKVVFTTGFAKNEIFKIGNEGCSKAELMIYLISMQNRYEEVFGKEVWQISRGDQSLKENVKDTALAKVAQIKSMYLLAQNRQISLDEKEEETTKRCAEAYFQSIGADRAEALELTQDETTKMFTQYAMADKVYHTIIGNVNPEISDEEARTMIVQCIVKNKNGLSEIQLQQAKTQLENVREQAIGGQDFYDLAVKNSQDENVNRTFSREDLEEELADGIFSLETGEISQVLEDSQELILVKCISTFDREKTQSNKYEIVKERRNETFGEEYDTFVQTLNRRLNLTAWNEVSVGEVSFSDIPDFFDAYAEYFPENSWE